MVQTIIKKKIWWIQKWDSIGQQPINLKRGKGEKEKWSTSKGENAKKMINTINEVKEKMGYQYSQTIKPN